MALKRKRHPDMNIHDLDSSITYEIYRNIDVDRGWEQLAVVVGYSVIQIQTFERETNRSDGSPSRKLLWDWGTRGATVRNLYEKLELIDKVHVMRMLDPIMKLEEKDQQDVDIKKENSHKQGSASKNGSLAKGEKLLLSTPPDPGTFSYNPSYNPSSLPVPEMNMFKPSLSPDPSLNVNIDKPDGNGQKNVKHFKRVLDVLSNDGASVESNDNDSGAGSSRTSNASARSLNRVRSLMEPADISRLNAEERNMALALMNTPNYTYKELSQATNGFSEQTKLGQGKFGAVYRGSVKNTCCAIKRIFQKHERNDEDSSSAHLSAELRALSRYRHENIVALYGYALDGDEVCLVYQFMPNGSLYDCLHRQRVQLDWLQRVAIMRGAACGLQFLHSVDVKPLIHGDIKSANILLNRHMEAKIGDLGLAQQATGGPATGKLTHITRKNVGTKDYENRAYQAPEILRGSGFSIKGDAYAFGVVMFECLTGLQAYDDKREGTQEKFLVAHIEDQMEAEGTMNIQTAFQDSQLKATCPPTMFKAVFNLACACTKDLKKDRPTLVTVFEDLEEVERVWQDVGKKKKQDEALRDKLSPCGDQSNQAVSTHLSQSSSGGYSPGVKATPQPNTLAVQPGYKFEGQTLMSPVDMLPRDQLPEAVKLQVDHDKRRMSETHVYGNVGKLHPGDKSVLVSDTKKLVKLEQGENEKDKLKSYDRKQKDIDEFDEKNMKVENTKTMNDADMYQSDPKKVKMLEQQEDAVVSKITAFQDRIYENFPVSKKSEPVASNYNNCAPAVSSSTDAQCGVDEQKVIQDQVASNMLADVDNSVDGKAKPIKNKMLDMLNTSKYENMAFDEYAGEGDDILMNFDELGIVDIDTEDSGSSTITESVADIDQLDSLLGINDDDLYGSSGSDVVYVNVPHRRPGPSDAVLHEHQHKWLSYQALAGQGEYHAGEGHRSDQPDREPIEADDINEQGTNSNSSHINDYGTGGREPTEGECFV